MLVGLLIVKNSFFSEINQNGIETFEYFGITNTLNGGAAPAVATQSLSLPRPECRS